MNIIAEVTCVIQCTQVECLIKMEVKMGTEKSQTGILKEQNKIRSCLSLQCYQDWSPWQQEWICLLGMVPYWLSQKSLML